MNVIVQTHPSRLDYGKQLAQQLDGRLVLDPEPDGPPAPWRTYQECIAEADPYTWTLILQDDATPHPDLPSVAQRIITAHPKRLVCLWHGRHPQNNAIRMHMAADRGYAYAECRATRFVPAVALLWPPHMIAGMQRWIPERHVPADDEMISRFLTQRNHHRDTYLVSVPCLVEHGHLPSLMGTPRPRFSEMPPPEDVTGYAWEDGYLPYL